MQQIIKLIGASAGSAAIPGLESEVNKWLSENADKDIIDLSIISEQSDPTAPQLSPKGRLIMIRYRGG